MKKKSLGKLRKVLSTILAMIIIMSAFSSLGIIASASSSGTCGDNLKWVYDGNTMVLTISGTGEMTNFASYSDVPWYGFRSYIDEIKITWGPTSISDYAFYHCDNVRAISIPTSVTSIGNYSFYFCYRVESLTIPWKVTTIGNYAFANCQWLESISLPDKLTSLGDYAFYKCVFLSSIDIPAGVKTIGDYTFYYCTRLKSVNLPDEMTLIGDYAFYDCRSLASIILPNGIPAINSNAFNGCENLTSVTVPETVQFICDKAFSGCTKLATVTLPEWLRGINESAFAYSGLTSIDIPGNVTTIEDKTFYSCDALTSVDIPDGVMSIGASAFEGCENLSSVTIPDSVVGIDFLAFRNCPNLTSINVDPMNTNYSSVDGVLFATDESVLVCYPAGKVSEHYVVPDTVTDFSYYAFAYTNGLRAVTISKNATNINAWAFYDSESLEEIIIPGSVVSVGISAFYGCDKLSLVHYLGTEDNWATVLESTNTNNEPLLKTTIHCCEQKTIDGTCINTGFENGWYCDACRKHITGGIPTGTNMDVHENDTYTDDGYRYCCGEYQNPVLNDEKVYEIYNAGQLFGFAELVNNGEKDADATLMADIDLKGAEWTPVCSTAFYCNDDYSTGDNYPDTGYSGVFDGNGFVISNISVSAVSDEKCTCGIFGTVSGSVKNVGVDKLIFNINNVTEVCVGGIAGQIIGGNIENCFVTNSVIAPEDHVSGGIAGCNLAGSIKNCYTFANAILGNSAPRYGHIVGDNHGDGGATDRPGTVTDCYTDGAVVIGVRKGNTENVSVLSSESFSSGELAYLLNSASAEQMWGQESNQEGATPVLDPTGLYKVVSIANTDDYSVANVGDANGDGVIDSNDYQAIVNMALSEPHSQIGTENYNEIIKYDLNGDGQLDVLDVSCAELLLNGHKTIDVFAVGDYDTDGEAFTENDVIAMAQAITTPESISTTQKYACDMNADGKVDETDLTILQKKYPMYFVGEN